MTEQEITAGSDASSRHNRRFMVIDSDAENLLSLSTLLKSLNYQTAAVRSAEEAFQEMERMAPALIIVALDLKDMSGHDLILQIKKNARFSDIPFITLRRGNDLPGKNRSRELGAADCLDIPVSLERLYQAVQMATEKTPRKCIRLKTIQPVTLNDAPDTGAGRPYTLDISEGGMFVRTEQLLSINTKVSVRFELNGEKIIADAAVIYLSQPGRGPWQEPGIGLVFVRIAPEDRERIRQFIRDELLRGGVPIKN